MKTAAKFLICMVVLLCISFLGNSQILKNIGNRVKQKVEQRADQKTDQAIDKGLDKVEETGKKQDSTVNPGNNNNTNKGNNIGDASSQTTNSNQVTTSQEQVSFKTYSKFDFVPGDKIIAVEEFSDVDLGDFPDKWNTNSTGEIQNIEGRNGKWLSISKTGVFLPEYITSLPENFTFEFELYCNKEYSFYSSAFNVIFASLKNPAKEFTNWKEYVAAERNGVLCWFHPQDAGMNNGHSGYGIWNEGTEEMKNEASTAQFTNRKNFVKVSIWRQKNRLRIYMNEEKVWDVPRAFSPDTKYNSVVIMRGDTWKPEDRYLFSNIRLAVGAPDTRNRLITEGKFVTRGILFDVSSDKIKPESYGVLKDIANVLTENSSVKVKIVGHTDADGSDADNLILSKHRAESVKNSLVKEFGIDASRLETDGKGESQPIDKNTTTEAKANNRRVEFIKL
jgi:OmpA-OmpF porin, OOP family